VCCIGTKGFHKLIINSIKPKCHIKPTVSKEENARGGESSRMKIVTRYFSTTDMLRKHLISSV